MTTSHAATLVEDLRPTGAADGPAAVDGWTAAVVDRYVAALPGPARTLLATMLGSPCPTDRAREAAGLDADQYAEAHACLEEALFVVPEVIRLPFDVVGRCFTVDPGTARQLRRALARR